MIDIIILRWNNGRARKCIRFPHSSSSRIEAVSLPVISQAAAIIEFRKGSSSKEGLKLLFFSKMFRTQDVFGRGKTTSESIADSIILHRCSKLIHILPFIIIALW
jgi:hypothetical protein